MKLVSVILCDFGYFNLHPQLLSQLQIPINSPTLRINENLVNLYNFYGNKIAQNCTLRIEKIPEEILNTKKVTIIKDYLGKETLDVYESNGDVVMKYW
jgi:hypothetical protein